MESKEVIRALAALAQESRLAIFRLLVEQGPQGLTVGRIAETLQIAPATLSFHLKELTHASLITARQDGRFIIYSTDFAAMNGLLGFLTENCCRASGDQCSPISGTACAPKAAAPVRAAKSTNKRRMQ